LTRPKPGAWDGPDIRPELTAATPVVMPAFALTHMPAAAHHDLYYETLVPLIAADGAIIPSAAGALPPDVIPAGRP
jgi:hypothetical protein